MGDVKGSGSTARLSDGTVALRAWLMTDARFLAEATADPAIRRDNGGHDRQGRRLRGIRRGGTACGYTYEGTMRAHSVWQGERSDVLWFAALSRDWTYRDSPSPT